MKDKPTSIEPRITQALSHPARVGFLRVLGTGNSLSPKQAMGLNISSKPLSLSQVNYHVRLLDRSGLVEGLGASPEGRSFQATAKGREALLLIGDPPGE
jgi:hypothetical protein